MTEFAPIKEGKVREIYDNGDSLIMVATDRISAFDVILKNKVTKKGTVLTQMSRFWFDFTRDLLPNHMISVNTADMPEFFRQEQFEGNSMLCRKLTMLPIECIVRGYITGSGWASYQGLRHLPARGPQGVRPSARAHLHSQHQGRPGRPRREYLLRAERPGSGEDLPGQGRGVRLQTAGLHHRTVQEVRRLRSEPRHHHCGYQV